MSEKFQQFGGGSATLRAAPGIKPLDQETGGVGGVIPVNAIIGISTFSFDFFNEGGTNNLLPGRSTTQTASLQPPAGTANGFICLNSISGAFVTNGQADLTERPLGQFLVAVTFGANNTPNCTIKLSDSNGDDPIVVQVAGTIIYFR